MGSGERLPKSRLGMNEWHPLDKMVVSKLWPLCINGQELGGSKSRWMERSHNQLIVMEAGLLSFTAFNMASRPFTAGFEHNDLQETHTDILNLTLVFGNPVYGDFCDFMDLENTLK